MVVASQLVAKVSTEGVDISKQQLQGMGQAVKETSGGFKSMLGNALSFVAGQAIFNAVGSAVGFLKDQTIDAVKLAMQHQDIMEQTTKVLQSTHNASGMTAQSLQDLASSLEKTTFFSKDTTEEGENLLLTFTGIGKDVFPLATKTMLDMSKAMGQDVKSTAIMMGKALNDPAQGLTALTRVGVTFTDQQKQMIQQMVATGDTAGAQKIMLQELQREFGGSADATTTAAGRMQIFKDRADDLKERMASGLLPVVLDLMDHIASPALDVAQNLFNDVGRAIHYIGEVLRSVDLSDFNSAWSSLNTVFRDIEARISKVGDAFKVLGTDADPLAPIIGNLAQGGLNTLSQILWQVEGGLMAFDKALATGKGPLDQFAGPVKEIASLLQGQFSQAINFAGSQAKQISTWFQGSGILKDVGQEFKNIAQDAFNLGEIFLRARGAAQDIIEHAFAKFAPYIEKILPPLIKLGTEIGTGIAGALQYVKPYIIEAIDAFEKFANGVIDRVGPIINIIMPYIIQGAKDVQAIWKVVWPSLQMILQGVFQSIVGIVQIAWSLVSGIINIGLDLLSGNWSQAWTDMQNMFGGIWSGIQNMLGGEIKILQGILGGIGALAYNYIVVPFLNAWSNVMEFFGNIGSWFHDRFMEVYNGVTGAIGTIAGWFHDNLIKPFEDDLGRLGGVFNAIAKLVGDASALNFGAIPGDLHSLGIPGFASGTSYAPGGWGIVGERGPEAMYIPRGAQIFPASQTAQMLSGGSATSGTGQPIILQIDGHTFARLFMPYAVGAIRNQVGVRF